MRWAGSTKSKVAFTPEIFRNDTYLLSIRSSSVIFVPAESIRGGIPSTSGAKDLANPYLGGFGFSRPKGMDANRYRRLKTSAPDQITLDSYHHPNKRFNPELRYLQAFDLYSYVQYPLLNLGVSTQRRHLKSTNRIALNSRSLCEDICEPNVN